MRLKSLVTAGVMASAFAFGVSAHADEADEFKIETEEKIAQETDVSPGITPDSFFYLFDKLFENVQLMLTFDPEKKSELLLQFAQERLAEANKMLEDDQMKYIADLIDDYVSVLEEAEEKVSEVVLDDEIDVKSKEQLLIVLEDTIVVDEGVEEVLEKEDFEKLTLKKDEAYLVANVVKDFDIEKVQILRELGFGYGQIAKVISLAEKSGKTELEIVAMLKDENKGFGQIAKELNLHLSEMIAKGNKSVIEEAVETENNEETEEIAEEYKNNNETKPVAAKIKEEKHKKSLEKAKGKPEKKDRKANEKAKKEVEKQKKHKKGKNEHVKLNKEKKQKENNAHKKNNGNGNKGNGKKDNEHKGKGNNGNNGKKA